MGTRSGDLDPAVLIHLNRRARMDTDALDDLLNRSSGLLGLSGRNDMRDVQQAASSGDDAAALALSTYLHRIRHYVGAYWAILGGLDVLTFTAGVGENSAAVRAGSLQGLERLGIRIDPERNTADSHEARKISTDDSEVTVLVVPTNEELEIARQSLIAIG
jgi:acetate kinase